MTTQPSLFDCIRTGIPTMKAEWSDLFNRRIHIQFEKADLKNDTEWFDQNYLKYKEFNDHHFKMTYPLFKWDNFIAWKAETLDDKTS